MKYFLPDSRETIEDAEEFDPKFPIGKFYSIQDFAEDVAEEYHNNRDGWEAIWPVTIAIILDNSEVQYFIVERDYDPIFRAYRKQDENL